MGNRRRRMLPALLCTALACSPLLSSGCASSDVGHAASGKSGKQGKTRVGSPMPAIVVKRLGSKKRIDLSALRGKVLLVDIWASWCAPCMEEMPLLDDMAGRLKDKGVEIIAISIDEDKDSAKTFLESRESWTLTVAHDPDGKVPELLQPAKMPTSYVVDGEGIIRYVNEGFERDDIKTLEKRLTQLARGAS